MGVRGTFILALGVAGGIAASQAPEFAQQYRQRVGGAIEELRRVAAEFDQDAARNGLDRNAALALHESSGEPLFRDRGRSMRHTIERLDRLSRQRAAFEQASSLSQPLVLFGSDAGTLRGTWRDFRPAVPVTAQGFAWAGAGFLAAAALALLLAELAGRSWRAFRRGRRERRLSAPPEPARPGARG